MQEFIRGVRILIVAVCLALFAVGIIWNLCYSALPEPDTDQTAAGDIEAVAQAENWEQQYTAEQMEKTAQSAVLSATEPDSRQQEQADAEEQLAALRIERERSWQQLLNGLQELQFEEKQQLMRQYEELQYKEKRLELLLKAKGLQHRLVVLEQQQANVIVAEEKLAEQYEKIYDLVQRNTAYQPEQIVLIPLCRATGNS